MFHYFLTKYLSISSIYVSIIGFLISYIVILVIKDSNCSKLTNRDILLCDKYNIFNLGNVYTFSIILIRLYYKYNFSKLTKY